MELKPFGKTDLKVTSLGLGLAALGRPGYINLNHAEALNHNYEIQAMEKHAQKIMKLAYEQGIRYFDAARSYGRAESFLSSWKKPNDIIIGSKWGYTYTADWLVNAEKHEIKEHSYTMLNKQFPASLNLLGDQLRIYHIHSATLDSKVLENQEVLERLWELKEDGIIVGLSLSGPQQGDTLLKSIEIKSPNGEQLFQSAQITWNIFEQSSTPSIFKAKEAGYGIIVKEAVANGRLTNNNQEIFLDIYDIIRNISSLYHISIDVLALAFVLNQPWIDIVLSGAATEEHLLSNLKASDVELSEYHLNELANLAEDSGKYWKTRSRLAWN